MGSLGRAPYPVLGLLSFSPTHPDVAFFFSEVTSVESVPKEHGRTKYTVAKLVLFLPFSLCQRTAGIFKGKPVDGYSRFSAFPYFLIPQIYLLVLVFSLPPPPPPPPPHHHHHPPTTTTTSPGGCT